MYTGVPDMPDVRDVAAALQAAGARLRAENAGLKAENAELKAQLAELAEKITRLERLVSRNSGNSSMPPGTDDQPGKKLPERKPRRRGGRKPGRQPGAAGAHLAWNGRPDQRIPHFPAGTCLSVESKCRLARAALWGSAMAGRPHAVVGRAPCSSPSTLRASSTALRRTSARSGEAKESSAAFATLSCSPGGIRSPKLILGDTGTYSVRGTTQTASPLPRASSPTALASLAPAITAPTSTQLDITP